MELIHLIVFFLHHGIHKQGNVMGVCEVQASVFLVIGILFLQFCQFLILRYVAVG